MYAEINLKYNDIDDWVELPINADSISFEKNIITQKNENGNYSYLALNGSTQTNSTTTSIYDRFHIQRIINYLIANFDNAEINIQGIGIVDAHITYSFNKNVTNLDSNAIATFSVRVNN